MATPQAQTVKKSPFPSQLGFLETAKLELRGKFPFQDFFMYRAKKKIAKEGRKGGGQENSQEALLSRKGSGTLLLFVHRSNFHSGLLRCTRELQERESEKPPGAGRQAGRPNAIFPSPHPPFSHLSCACRYTRTFFPAGLITSLPSFRPLFLLPISRREGGFQRGEITQGNVREMGEKGRGRGKGISIPCHQQWRAG